MAWPLTGPIPFLGIYPKEIASDLDLSASMLCSWLGGGGGKKKEKKISLKTQSWEDSLDKHAGSKRKSTKQR